MNMFSYSLVYDWMALKITTNIMVLCVWGGDNLRIILVRVCGPVFLNIPQSNAWSSKKRPIHILDLTKCLHIHILFFDFLYTIFAVCKQSLQNIITILVSELNI